MRPGPFAQHLVALQTGLVGLTEGVARSANTDVLHQAQVVNLMTHQGLGEDVGGLLVIGFDTSEEQRLEFDQSLIND